ncbi:hypothetical protein BDQ17DRAFT_752331 [Cyathus striatus]|nr:hypothetical protein BDQ17DRAFT_752331 [Cyathus striatus]
MAYSSLNAFVENQRIINNMRAAGLVIWVYDSALMVSTEITWIWSSQWSWNRIKVLYLLTRYSITIDILLFAIPYIFPSRLGLTPGGCQPNKIFYYVTTLVPTIEIMIALAILSLITRAILGQKRTWTIFLLVICALSVIGAAVTLGLYLRSVQIDNGCWHIPVGATAWILGPFQFFL